MPNCIECYKNAFRNIPGTPSSMSPRQAQPSQQPAHSAFGASRLHESRIYRRGGGYALKGACQNSPGRVDVWNFRHDVLTLQRRKSSPPKKARIQNPRLLPKNIPGWRWDLIPRPPWNIFYWHYIVILILQWVIVIFHNLQYRKRLYVVIFKNNLFGFSLLSTYIHSRC